MGNYPRSAEPDYVQVVLTTVTPATIANIARIRGAINLSSVPQTVNVCLYDGTTAPNGTANISGVAGGFPIAVAQALSTVAPGNVFWLPEPGLKLVNGTTVIAQCTGNPQSPGIGVLLESV